MLAALALFDLRALCVEGGRAALRLDPIGALACLQRKGLACLGFREFNRGGQAIAFRQLVDEAGLPGRPRLKLARPRR